MTEKELPKVYICGPMTGLPDNNYPAFFKAERYFLDKGFMVFNPARNTPRVENPTWSDWMRLAVKQLVQCDFIYYLPCAGHLSHGVIAERFIAGILQLIEVPLEY